MPHDDLDLTAIVGRTSLLTPADIEFAARRTAQIVFERVMLERGDDTVTTSDVMAAVSQTRRTLTPRSSRPSSRTSRTTRGSENASSSR
jgi:transitional endoplasmic reticulum ATPase